MLMFIGHNSQCCTEIITPGNHTVGFISPSCLLQRQQAVMLTMEAAAMAAPRCWTPIGATVPEGWSWETINAHVRVCMSVCM